MLRFHPSLPFPIVAPEAYTYAEAQTHSAAVDRWLGLRTEEVELALLRDGCRQKAPEASGDRQELWFGLDPQSLLTPYVEIRCLLDQLKLKPGQCVIDLGAGYGRMAFVIHRHHPGVRFVGYEYVGERVREARRCMESHEMNPSQMRHVDLAASCFQPDLADVYFLYDYGTAKAIEKTLHDLRKIARARDVVLVARGRHCRYAIERTHRWLRKLDPTASESRVTIYRSSRDTEISPSL